MRSKHAGWLRYPRTAQEIRANGKRSKWARPRRSAANLPTAREDIPTHTDKCWKSKRKNQYYVGGRGKKQVVYFESDGFWYGRGSPRRSLVGYLDAYCIPYTVETISKIHVKHEVITHHSVRVEKKVPDLLDEGRPYYFWTRYEWIEVPLEKPYIKTRKWSTVEGYKVSFWTDKRLDLSRFVENCP